MVHLTTVSQSFKIPFPLTLIHGCSRISEMVGLLIGFGESILSTRSLPVDEMCFHS